MKDSLAKALPAKRPILSFPFGRMGVRYVDYKVQMRMLIALVAMELTIISVGLAYLYYRFASIIDANIYRIHKQASTDVFSVMLQETTWVLSVSVLINLAALLIADRVWIRYVRSIVGAFGSQADRIADLDFRVDHPELETQHESIDMIQTWYRGERQRSMEIRTALNAIVLNDVDDPEGRERIRGHLVTIQKLLPPYSRRFVGRIRRS
ncbi:MAG: hypothetical protein HW380_3365 [Magnetococcales bacterium]|nr:hypothetical protein [Magnetococcales bacterium]HIJ84944.1 hypothetical protein [Magnetococcales bacterium]